MFYILVILCIILEFHTVLNPNKQILLLQKIENDIESLDKDDYNMIVFQIGYMITTIIGIFTKYWFGWLMIALIGLIIPFISKNKSLKIINILTVIDSSICLLIMLMMILNNSFHLF